MRRMDLFGRLGGEEFAALLVDTTRERALAVAEQIRASFAAATCEVEGRPVVATVSIGIVISHDAVLDLSALLAQADHALYRAKDNGRDRIEIASFELILDRARGGAADRLATAVAEIGRHISASTAAAASFDFRRRRRRRRRCLADDEQNGVLANVPSAVSWRVSASRRR